MSLTLHFTAQDLRHHRRLSGSMTTLSKTLKNLSTGVRTEASDLGGADLAISQRIMTALKSTKAELRGLNSNASLLQTLDGALAEATDSLHRLRELALQASNSQTSLEDRQAIEQQFKALIQQVKTISEDTQYNGRALLDGQQEYIDLSLASEQRQVQNSKSHQASKLQLPDLNPLNLGKHVSYVGQGRGVFLSPLASNQIELNGVSIRGTVDSDDRLSYQHGAGSAIAKAKAINASSALTGVTAKADMNLYRGFAPIKGADLNQEHWLQINGEMISALSFEDLDANGTLRSAINAHFSKTGVMASADSQGQLILAAPDGRNISLVFSDVELRNALGIRDLYGDDVNFSPDVDPPEYSHYGDISSVEYVNNSSKALGTPMGQFSGHFEILDSKFTKAQDGVDYIFEVVKGGLLGEAQFRVKEEQLDTGIRDLPHEDYEFGLPGSELTPPSPKKVRLEDSQYMGASQLRVGFKVLSPGSPQSTLISEQPLVEVFVTSLDDPSVNAFTLGQFRISNNEPLDLSSHGLDIQLNFPIDETRSLLDQNGQEFKLRQGISPNFLPLEHDYDPLQPFVATWDGIHSTQFTVEVIESGHSIGERDYSFTDETPAKIRVTADLLHQNRTIINEYTLDEYNQTYVTGVGVNGSTLAGGLGLIFPSAFGKAQTSISREVTGDYNFNPTVYNHRFVGTEAREYEITLTSDGIISYQLNDGGPSADVKVYGFDDLGQRELIQTYTIDELNGGERSIYLGEGSEKDGLRIKFPRGASLLTINKSRDPGAYLNFSAYRYNELNPRVGVVEITKAGVDSGPQAAEYIYYYQDDPDTILASGTVNKYTHLPDDTLMRSWVVRQFRSETEGLPNNIGFIRDFSYSRSQGGSFTSEIIDQEGTLTLRTVWAEGSQQEEVFETEFHSNRYLDIGYGLNIYIYRDRLEASNIDNEAIKVSGSVSAPNHFQVGDTFSYGIKPNLAKEGDQFTIKIEPVDLVKDAQWRLQAIGPDWKPNDVYYSDIDTGFDSEAFTITDHLTYPFDDSDPLDLAQSTLGEIKVSGSGRLEVGDQIRVGTRAFVGEVRTSGAYTNPAFPTDYILTVTKGGEIADAELSWVREDGLVDTELGGIGTLTGLTEGQDAYLEEGVFVSFHDLGQGAYLAQGDQIRISVGQNLEYTFGGQVNLHAREAIEIKYTDAEVDRQLGKISFTGSDEEALSPKFHQLSLAQSRLAIDPHSSLAHAGLLSRSEIDQALTTIDTALADINEARTEVGARLNRLEHQAGSLFKQVIVYSQSQERIRSVDYAQSISEQTSAQIRLMSHPLLNQVAQTNALRVLDLISQPALQNL